MELLKKKVVELSRDVNNTEISKCAAQLSTPQKSGGFNRFSPFSPPAMEILKLQSEVENTKLLMVKEKNKSETLITGERCKYRRRPICC